MQRHLQLSKILEYIEKAVTHIITECENISADVKENGDFVEDLVKVFPKASRDEIQTLVLDKINSYAALSIAVKAQLDPFVDALDAHSVENDESGTFDVLKEIWLGDTYGVDGINGLKELGKELTQVIESLKDEELLKALAAAAALALKVK